MKFNIFLITITSISIIIFTYLIKKIITQNIKSKELIKEKKLQASIFKLSHEIKNPLAVCKGYLDMLPQNDLDKQQEYINIIQDELNRSIEILNDFSSFGKISHLEKEELDLAILFEDIEKNLNPLFQANNSIIKIPKEDEFYVQGDYKRLKQVMLNILKNSLEAKNKDILEVDIKMKNYKDYYQISIIDNGKGMTKKELNHIYELFYTTKEYGSGVGVPYIKEIINLHGGSINYKSSENKGTTVTINLPIEQKNIL